jgi:hypothetical protein
MKRSSTITTSFTVARRATRDVARYDTRRVNLAKFKPDITAAELRDLGHSAFDRSVFPTAFGNIETLSPVKTLGRGRTNLTIIRPTIVQVDAAVPRASFDLAATPTRHPVMQMHFEPAAYGISFVSTYLMVFTVEVFGQGTFLLDGFRGPGGISNPGTRTISGRTTVTLIFPNLAPDQQIFGFIEQQAGARWDWFATQVSFPPIVATL